MEIGVFAFQFVQWDGMPLDTFLAAAAGLGVRSVELGTGGFVTMPECAAADLLASAERRSELLGRLTAHHLRLAALNAIGNPFHPDREVAARCRDGLYQSIELAGRLGIDRLVTGSGCPGDGAGASHPNWAVYPYFLDDLWERQWQEQILPFWREAAARARDNGVHLCFELHPVMAVYNCSTFWRLREAAGEAIAVNLDPSHLFWTGMDPFAVIRELGPHIRHVHAKDTRLDAERLGLDGFLDPTPFARPAQRTWNYCAVGDGHDAAFWRRFIAGLAAVGFTGTVSVEHEDVTIRGRPALERNVRFLQQVIG